MRGLNLRRREVQERFLAGDLQVIVDHYRLGMGIEKADVRTVILKSRLQQPGKRTIRRSAAPDRDALPSRAILMTLLRRRYSMI